MKAVLPRGFQVDVRLLHLIGLVLLHKLVALPFGGHHLVAVVSNELLWSLREIKSDETPAVKGKAGGGVKRALTSFGATGRCVLLSSSLSTNMYLQRR